MKTKLKAFVMGLIMTVLVMLSFGCQGPAKTTISPMKNVGPITLMERRTVVTPGGTNMTMFERLESPESAQVRLREKELKERGKKRGGGYQYWWQTNPLLYPGGGSPGGDPAVGYNYVF